MGWMRKKAKMKMKRMKRWNDFGDDPEVIKRRGWTMIKGKRENDDRGGRRCDQKGEVERMAEKERKEDH